MPRPVLLLLPALILTACERTGGVLVEETCYPQASVSTSTLDFGEVAWQEVLTKSFTLNNDGDLPMGVGDIVLNIDEMEDNFTVAYSFANVVCPEGADTGASSSDGGADDGDGGGDDTAGGGDTANSEVVTISSAADTGDYYGNYDGGASGSSDDESRILGPGCSLPIDVTISAEQIGGIYGSVSIYTQTEEVDEDAEDPQEPTYFADPDTQPLTVILSASGDKGAPNIYVSPRALDFGTVWEGDSSSLLVDVQNTGETDLTLKQPYLDEACDDGYSIDWTYGDDHVLPGGTLSGVEVTFTPVDDNDAACTLWIESDDPDEPFIDISMEANEGGDPNECAPTINLIHPTVGYEHLTGDDLDVIFEVYDCNEPAQNLELQLRSGVLFPDDPVLVDTFHAPDESGYVEASIPRDSLGRGTDTIIIRAEDSAGNRVETTTTVMYRATYPSSDDDGDGYGTEDEDAYDCDDGNRNTYPAAMEVYDLADNDCDGVIDEGTEGYDDDGDGWSEAEGDCNDADPESNPEAEELPDFEDNNCDGEIDENTTLADDDGDGFAEYEGDCDDGDPEVNPLATEYCDGIDNDCNGIMDERDGCVGLSTEPLIIGGIQADVTSIALGESVTLSAFVYDADGDPIAYGWQQDPVLTQRGYVGIENPGAPTITFTAPPSFPDEDTVSETYNIKVVVTDPDSALDSADIDIKVYADNVPVCDVTETKISSGCGSSSSDPNVEEAAALLVPGSLVAMLALFRRRREEEEDQD